MASFTRKRLNIAFVFLCCALIAVVRYGAVGKAETSTNMSTPVQTASGDYTISATPDGGALRKDETGMQSRVHSAHRFDFSDSAGLFLLNSRIAPIFFNPPERATKVAPFPNGSRSTLLAEGAAYSNRTIVDDGNGDDSPSSPANTYAPNTFTDPVINTLNNTTGAINGGTTISLRSALMAADNLGGTHTVNLSTGTYNLTQAIPNRQITIGNRAENITINGNGPANTIINNTLDANKDRILFINPQGTSNSPVITVNGIRFQNGFLSSDPFGGAAICAGGGSAESLTVTNCAFDNNVLPANAYGGAAVNMQVRGNLTIDNSTFTNNVSNDADGGAVLFILFNSTLGTSFGTLSVTNSTFTGNSVIFPGAGTANGGALAFTGQAGVTPFNATITKNTFTGNTADGLGGAISANNSPNLSIPQIHFNRFSNNSSTTSALSSGLHFVESSGSVNAENNWWGCNSNPVSGASTAPCNQAGGDVAGGGSLDADPWLQLKTTESPTQICTNTASTFTASFLTNSSNTAVGLSNLSRLIGLPISFVNPVLGTLSGAQTTIQAAGTATVTYTSGAVGGTGSVNAVVDNIPNNDVAPAKSTIFVSKPVVANPGVSTGTAGAVFSQTFTASGGVAPYTYTTLSPLPTGITLSAGGVLSGTPTVVGTFPIVVTATCNIGCTGNGSTYNLVIACQTITVTKPATTTAIVGTLFSQTFTQTSAIGGATFTLNSGTLPTGITLSAGGVLSGTPTQSGSFPITVKVTDGNGCTGISTAYTLVVSCQTITVTNPATTSGIQGEPFSQNFTQNGALAGATFTLNSGTLPTGLTLSAGGVLSGTPTQSGSFPITVKVTDGNACTGIGSSVTIMIVSPTPTNTATNTPTATVTATSTPTNTATNTPTATPTVATTPSLNGTVTYGNAVSGPTPPRFVSNVLISGAGSPNVSTTTAAPGATAGQYSLTGFGSGAYTVTPTKTGGANGGITSFDAARISQHVAGTNLLTGNQLIVADVSGNGTITSFDAANISNFVVTAAPAGSTGTWRFAPVNRTYATVTTPQTAQDYSALLMGEVSGNWINTGGRPEDSGNSGRGSGPERSTAVSAPHLVTPADNEVLVPVSVEGIADKGIISYEFDLRYDPSVIQPQANPVDLAGTVSRRLSVAVGAEDAGLLRVAVYGPVPIEGSGVLLNLRFTAVGAPGAMSTLTWERLMFNEGDPETTTTDGQVELSAASPNQAQISGRLLTAMGQGVSHARVILTDTTGKTHSVFSNGFGVYRFVDLQVGQTYTISVESKRFSFSPVTVSAADEFGSVDMIAE